MIRFLLSLFIIFFSMHTYAELVERVVAIVNTEVILSSDLAALNNKLDKAGLVDELLLFGKKPSEMRTNTKEQLDYLINEKILDSEIKRLNLSVTMERVEQEIRDIAKKNRITRAEMMSALSAQGISASQYQDFLKTSIERHSLIESEVTSKIRVSDEDVLAQYLRVHPDNETSVFEYTLAHILFNPKKGGAEAALARAQQVLSKLRAGAAFEVLAEQNSEDSNFSAGGLLGTFKAGEFDKELETAVSKLRPDEYSGVVRSHSGFHILKVLNKKVVTDPRFDKEKEKLRSQLFEAALQKHFKNWLDEKREDSFIRINKL